MRDHERGPTAHDPGDRLLDQRLRLRVDVCGCLVEDQDARIAEDRASEGHELTLSDREILGAFRQRRVIALRETLDPLIGADHFGRGDRLLTGRLKIAVEDVVEHRAREQERILQDNADALHQRRPRHFAYVVPIDPHGALGHFIVAGDQRGDRGLAGASLADQCDRFAGLDFEIKVEQDPDAIDVLQRDIVEMHVTGNVRQVLRVGGVLDLGLGVEHFKHPLRAGHRALEHRVLQHQVADRVEEALDADREGDNRRDAGRLFQTAAAEAHRRHHDDQRGRERNQDFDQRHDRGREQSGLAGRTKIPVVDPVEPLGILRLAIQTLHDSDAVEVFVQSRVDGCDRDARLEERHPCALAPPGHRDDQDGQHGEGNKGQLPINEQQHGHDDHQAEYVANHGQHAGRQHLLQHLDVGSDPRHDRADLAPVIEAMLQPHQMIENLLTHASQDRMPDIGHQPLTQELRAPRDQHDHAEGECDPVELREDPVFERSLERLVDDQDLDVERDREDRVGDNRRQ